MLNSEPCASCDEAEISPPINSTSCLVIAMPSPVPPYLRVVDLSACSNRLNKLEAEDTLVAIMRFSSGALGTIEATTAARPEDFEASLSVVGETGMALIGGIALNKVKTWEFIEPTEEDKRASEQYSQEVETGYGISHGPLLQQVIDSLRNDCITPPVSASDAIQTTRFVHAIYRSDELQGWVSLSDNPISTRLGQ